MLEFMAEGTLWDYVNKRKCLEEHQICNLAIEILIALDYYQRNRVLHRDLKPENILLGESAKDSKLQVRLADFGFAVNEVRSTYDFRCGTPGFMAPEIISSKKYSHKSDIFSVGAIIYYMSTGKQIFRSKTKEKVFAKTLECDLQRYSEDLTCSEALKKLILSLLQYHPDKRPSALEALQFEFFEDYTERINSGLFNNIQISKANMQESNIFGRG